MTTTQLSQIATPLENELMIGLSTIPNHVQDYESSGEWTKAVNEVIYKIAKRSDRNYLIAADKLQSRDCFEWLYDIVLYENNQFGLDNVHLVLECEWQNRFFDNEYSERIQEDFEKILLAKTQNKVMIIEGKNAAEVENYFKQMSQTITHSKLTTTGERYLLCGWNQQSYQFMFDIIIGN